MMTSFLHTDKPEHRGVYGKFLDFVNHLKKDGSKRRYGGVISTGTESENDQLTKVKL
jgi:hypothetical protein